MTLHLCVLGIDGSGKSTVAATLPALLAGELGVRVAAAGEAFVICDPDDDLLAPGFEPDGVPLSVRLSRRLKRWAKRFVNHRRIYPVVKVSQLAAQDQAARGIARRWAPGVVVSDGNALLSALGRAANYVAPRPGAGSPGAEDLLAAFAYLLDGRPLPARSRARLPALGAARALHVLLRAVGLGGLWLPDVVVLLDLSPPRALERIAGRGAGADAHENARDLAAARDGYLRVLAAVARRQGAATATRIPCDGRSAGDVLAAIAGIARSAIAAAGAPEDVRAGSRPLGTTTAALSGKSVWSKVLNRRYLLNYLVGKSAQGAWREPLFPFSAAGRLFLAEGYSAAVMRAIYDRAPAGEGFFERAFMEYPLHRAVHDRLQQLVPRIEAEIERRLDAGAEVAIFTAPSGFAYDILRPLEAVLGRRPGAAERIRVLAADLDPAAVLGDRLAAAAGGLGVRLTFVRGDLTDEATRARFDESAPYDLALFVGLSSWLPKGPLLRHLRWIRGSLRPGGVLFTDCFTPAAYSYSGRYVGYRANYYEPAVMRGLLDFCGLDGLAASVASGRDRINHVIVASARPAPGNGA